MASTLVAKIDGIDGQSLTDGHDKWIDLDHWGWSQALVGVDVTESTGGTTGKGMVGEVVCSKGFDVASANLALYCISGQAIKEIQIKHMRASTDNKMEEFGTLTLTHCHITNYSISGADGSKPTENFSIAASHWNWKTKKQKDDGSTETGPESQWNAKTGKSAAAS